MIFRNLASLTKSFWRHSHLGVILLCLGTMLACSKSPENQAKVRFENSQKDMYTLSSKVRLPDRSLHLEDFLGYALNRNLDLMGLRMEYEIQQEILTGQKLGMLPGLTYNVDVSRKSHEVGSTSKSLITGAESSSSSVSSEKLSNRKDLSFAWSLIDFGVSYYRSRQEFSRGLILQERYKRLRQNLILDVIQAYWKAVISQKAAKGAESIVNLAKERQKNLKKQIESQTISEIQGLENEERLIEMQIRLQTFQSDLESAKSELASLLGLPPGVSLDIAEAELKELEVPNFIIEDLEETALVTRPELYIQDLEKRVAADEVKAAMVSMFPNAQLFGNVIYDRNRFLVQNTWYTMGTRAAYNLLAMPRYRKLHKVAEKRLEMAEKSRLSISVGVLAQVHLAYLAYLNASSQHKLSKELYSVKNRLLNAVKKGERLGQFGGAELLRLEAEALFAKVNAVTAYAEMQVALERVNNSIGKSLFYSHIKLEDVDSSLIGLVDLMPEKKKKSPKLLEPIPKEAIQEREEEKEEDLEVELSEEESQEALSEVVVTEEELEEKEVIEKRKKKREELPEPPKVFADYLRGWIRAYSADEEWEDIEVEEGTATADEEYEFYEEEVLEQEQKEKELPEPVKPEKEVEFVFNTVKSRRSSGERNQWKNLLKGAELSRLDRLRKLLGMMEVTKREIDELEIVEKIEIRFLEREEILAYLSYDDADEWISDSVLKNAEMRYQFLNRMTSEEILHAVDEDQSDLLLEGKLLTRLIQERPANDLLAKEELRRAIELDRIRQLIRMNPEELAEELKDEDKESQSMLRRALEKELVSQEKDLFVVEDLLKGIRSFFKSFNANSQIDAMALAEKALEKSKGKGEKREIIWKGLSDKEIKMMLEEDHADEEITGKEEWDLAEKALSLEISLDLRLAQAKKEKINKVSNKKETLKRAAIFDLTGAENRAEGLVPRIYNKKWVENKEEKLKVLEIKTRVNPLDLMYDDISDLVFEDSADEVVPDSLFELSIEEGRFEKAVPNVYEKELVEEFIHEDSVVSSAEERFEGAMPELSESDEIIKAKKPAIIEKRGAENFEARIPHVENRSLLGWKNLVSDEADEQVIEYDEEPYILATEADEVLEHLPKTSIYSRMNENFADESIKDSEVIEYQLSYADEGMTLEQVEIIKAERADLEKFFQKNSVNKNIAEVRR